MSVTLHSDFLADDLVSNEISAERRRTARVPVQQTGRLAYGGLAPKLVGCGILDVSETGVRVETYAPLVDTPEFFTLEFGGTYYRARRTWTAKHQIGLEFVFDEMAETSLAA